MMNILQVSIARHTRNYETLTSFYHDILGMEVTFTWDEPDNRGTLLAFGGEAGNTVVEVIELGNEAVPGAEPVNIALSIEVDDVDAWQKKLLEQNINIARKLEDAPWGHRSFGIDDPDGFRIWYYQDMNPKQS